jgi:hypothetical protein
MSDGSTSPAQLPVLETDDLLEVFAFFGVGDMVGIQGTEDRVVTIAATSDVVCPMHERRLVPDACRSCRFLAGEVR